MKKKCKRCKEEKYIEEFYKAKTKSGYKGTCIQCLKHSNSIYQEKLRTKKREIIATNKTYCLKCGENRKQVLHFHHLDSSKKEFTISDINDISIENLKKEISKCIVLCSNCHLDFHYLERTKNITIQEYLQF